MIVTDEGVAVPENGEIITPDGAWLSQDGDILIPDELDPDIVMGVDEVSRKKRNVYAKAAEAGLALLDRWTEAE